MYWIKRRRRRRRRWRSSLSAVEMAQKFLLLSRHGAKYFRFRIAKYVCQLQLQLYSSPLSHQPKSTPQLSSYHMANKHSHFSQNFRIISCFLFSGLTRKFYGRALHINESFCLILTKKAGLVMFLNVFAPRVSCFSVLDLSV